MDQHMYFPQWANLANTTIPSASSTPPVPQSPLQFTTQQQQQSGQSAFAGNGFPGSATPYQPPSAQSTPTPSATPVPQQSHNSAVLQYPYLRPTVSATSNPILPGTNGASVSTQFYTSPYYTPSTGNLPISQYSSLSGATGGQLSSSSSQPQPTFSTVQPQQTTLQQTTTPQAIPANSNGVRTIDPSLLSQSSASYTRQPYGATPSTGLQPYGASYQYFAPPNYLLQQTAQGYASINRTPTPQTSLTPQTPAIAFPTPTQLPTPLPNVQAAPAAALPNGGLSPNWKDVLTTKTLDKAPENTANSIISLLRQSSWNDVDRPTRMEILTKIRDHAGSEFYKVWAKSVPAIEVLQDWLKATLTKEGWDDTLMPILFIIDRLPITVETLQSSKIAKVIVKLVKGAPSQAVKDLATTIETRWRELVKNQSTREGSASTSVKAEDGAAKKRKIEPPLAKTGPPAKKPAVGSSSASKPATVVKKVVPVQKEIKSDSSFFSSKPKAKLPSFTKKTAVTAVKKEEPDTNVAQPSSTDAFQEALRSMQKKPSGSPAPASAEPELQQQQQQPPAGLKAAAQDGAASTIVLGRNGKPKKRVTFPADDKLVQIKLIERAIYDDDATGEGPQHGSYRDLDIDEGHALHALMFEEQLDWFEPAPYDITDEESIKVVAAKGSMSIEKHTQEQRESGALMAVYMDRAQIPETPGEPRTDGPPDESGMVMMTAGEKISQLEAPAAAAPSTTASLQELLARINPDFNANSVPLAPPLPYDDDYGNDGPSPYDQGGWGGGGGSGGYDSNQQSSSSDHWDGSGLPPPTGLSDGWEADGPPSGPRRGRERQSWQPPRLPPGVYKYNTPCRFYNTPFGCRNGAGCPFQHERSR